MSKPIFHAQSSARIFGGKAEDYLELHELMDSTKASFPDVRHRILTHNSWFVEFIIPKLFGRTIKNSDGKEVSTSEIAEQHVLEDYRKRFIPTPQDWISNVEFKEWMNNGRGEPPDSFKKIDEMIIGKYSKHIAQVD